MNDIKEIRCYLCEYYKATSKFSGWCKDAKPNIRVNAIDFCDFFKEIIK